MEINGLPTSRDIVVYMEDTEFVENFQFDHTADDVKYVEFFFEKPHSGKTHLDFVSYMTEDEQPGLCDVAGEPEEIKDFIESTVAEVTEVDFSIKRDKGTIEQKIDEIKERLF